ncbi:MAG TPA: hypothetical protein VD978_12735 [Azospirillum sp.]|nr:hypothetical protein [Azospirillum sp.]
MSQDPSARLLRDAYGRYATGVAVMTTLNAAGAPVGPVTAGLRAEQASAAE